MTTTLRMTLIALSMGVLLGGCALQEGDPESPDETSAERAAQKKKVNRPTRDEQIAACKADCERENTPCGNPFPAPGGGGVSSNCNPSLGSSLEPNPFALPRCNAECEKL